MRHGAKKLLKDKCYEVFICIENIVWIIWASFLHEIFGNNFHIFEGLIQFGKLEIKVLGTNNFKWQK